MTNKAENAIGFIRENDIRDEADLLAKCRFTLKCIGSGAFRNVYAIQGIRGIVIKVPIRTKSACGLAHARSEMDAFARVRRSKKKFASIQKYLPNVPYWNRKTGIMVMERYKVCHSRRYWKQMEGMRQEFEELFGSSDSDLYSSNVGMDAEGNMKVIDLGLILNDAE